MCIHYSIVLFMECEWFSWVFLMVMFAGVGARVIFPGVHSFVFLYEYGYRVIFPGVQAM